MNRKVTKSDLRAGTVGLGLWLLSHAALADEQATQALVERLSRISQFEGGFHQTITDESGQSTSELDGRFSIEVPGRVRWETYDPYPQLLVSDGERYWLYDPDLAQVTLAAVDDRLQSTPAVLFTGDAEAVSAQFEVTQAGAENPEVAAMPSAPAESDAADHFILSPKQVGGVFSRLEVAFEGEHLRSLTMEDSLGQRTRFDFSDTRLNQPLPASEFVFQVPAGVDLIEQ